MKKENIQKGDLIVCYENGYGCKMLLYNKKSHNCKMY